MKANKTFVQFRLIGFLIVNIVLQSVENVQVPDNTNIGTINNQVHRYRKESEDVPSCGYRQYFDKNEGICRDVTGRGRILNINPLKSCGTDVLKPHCSNPKYYYICERNMTILAECVEGQYFVDRFNGCVYASPINLRQQRIRPDQEILEYLQPPACRKRGRFPIPGHCNLFYTCKIRWYRMIQTIFRCPAEMEYDNDLKYCVYSRTCKNTRIPSICLSDTNEKEPQLSDPDEIVKETRKPINNDESGNSFVSSVQDYAYKNPNVSNDKQNEDQTKNDDIKLTSSSVSPTKEADITEKRMSLAGLISQNLHFTNIINVISSSFLTPNNNNESTEIAYIENPLDTNSSTDIATQKSIISDSISTPVTEKSMLTNVNDTTNPEEDQVSNIETVMSHEQKAVLDSKIETVDFIINTTPVDLGSSIGISNEENSTPLPDVTELPPCEFSIKNKSCEGTTITDEFKFIEPMSTVPYTVNFSEQFDRYSTISILSTDVDVGSMTSYVDKENSEAPEQTSTREVPEQNDTNSSLTPTQSIMDLTSTTSFPETDSSNNVNDPALLKDTESVHFSSTEGTIDFTQVSPAGSTSDEAGETIIHSTPMPNTEMSTIELGQMEISSIYIKESTLIMKSESNETSSANEVILNDPREKSIDDNLNYYSGPTTTTEGATVSISSNVDTTIPEEDELIGTTESTVIQNVNTVEFASKSESQSPLYIVSTVPSISNSENIVNENNDTMLTSESLTTPYMSSSVSQQNTKVTDIPPNSEVTGESIVSDKPATISSDSVENKQSATTQKMIYPQATEATDDQLPLTSLAMSISEKIERRVRNIINRILRRGSLLQMIE